jgi:hypothetical protein
MAQVKAAGVMFLKQKLHELGSGAEERLLAELTPEVAEDYKTALPLTWLPAESVASIYEASARIIYPNHPNGIQQLGHDTAVASYTGVYRVLLRAATVAFLMQKAPRIWRNHHTDGDMKAEAVTERSAIVSIYNYPDLLEPIRHTVAGFFTGLCALAGGRDPIVRQENQPSVWRWIITWS